METPSSPPTTSDFLRTASIVLCRRDVLEVIKEILFSRTQLTAKFLLSSLNGYQTHTKKESCDAWWRTGLRNKEFTTARV